MADENQEDVQLVHLHPRDEVEKINELLQERQGWSENRHRTVWRAEVLREIVSAGLPLVEERQRARHMRTTNNTPVMGSGDH